MQKADKSLPYPQIFVKKLLLCRCWCCHQQLLLFQ